MHSTIQYTTVVLPHLNIYLRAAEGTRNFQFFCTVRIDSSCLRKMEIAMQPSHTKDNQVTRCQT